MSTAAVAAMLGKSPTKASPSKAPPPSVLLKKAPPSSIGEPIPPKAPVERQPPPAGLSSAEFPDLALPPPGSSKKGGIAKAAKPRASAPRPAPPPLPEILDTIAEGAEEETSKDDSKSETKSEQEVKEEELAEVKKEEETPSVKEESESAAPSVEGESEVAGQSRDLAVGSRNESSDEDFPVRPVSRYQDRPPGVKVRLPGDEAEESDSDLPPPSGDEPPGGPGGEPPEKPPVPSPSESPSPGGLEEEEGEEEAPEVDEEEELLETAEREGKEYFAQLDREEAERSARAATAEARRSEAPTGGRDIRANVETYVPPAVPLTDEENLERVRRMTEENLESRRRAREAAAAAAAASNAPWSSASNIPRSSAVSGPWSSYTPPAPRAVVRVPNRDQQRAFDELDTARLQQARLDDLERYMRGEITRDQANEAEERRRAELSAERLARSQRQEASRGRGSTRPPWEEEQYRGRSSYDTPGGRGRSGPGSSPRRRAYSPPPAVKQRILDRATEKREREGIAAMARLGLPPIDWAEHVATFATPPPWATQRTPSGGRDSDRARSAGDSQATRVATPRSSVAPEDRPASTQSSRVPSLEPLEPRRSPVGSGIAEVRHPKTPVRSSSSADEQLLGVGSYTVKPLTTAPARWGIRRKRASVSPSPARRDSSTGVPAAKTPRSTPPASTSPVSSATKDAGAKTTSQPEATPWRASTPPPASTAPASKPVLQETSKGSMPKPPLPAARIAAAKPAGTPAAPEPPKPLGLERPSVTLATTPKAAAKAKVQASHVSKVPEPKGAARTTEAEVRAKLIATVGDPTRIPKADKKKLRDQARMAVFKERASAAPTSPSQEPLSPTEEYEEPPRSSDVYEPPPLPEEEWDETAEEEDRRLQEAELRRLDDEAEAARFRRGGPSSGSGAAPAAQDRQPSPDRRRPRDEPAHRGPESWKITMLEAQQDRLIHLLGIAQANRNRVEVSEISAELNSVATKLAALSRQSGSGWNQPSKGQGRGSSKGSGPPSSQRDYGKDKRRRM